MNIHDHLECCISVCPTKKPIAYAEQAWPYREQGNNSKFHEDESSDIDCCLENKHKLREIIVQDFKRTCRIQ